MRWAGSGPARKGFTVATEHSTASRSGFLRLGLAGAGTLSLGAVLASGAPRAEAASPSPALDVQVLNYALLLEELQVAFYAAALDRGKLRGELRDFARVVVEHEREHVGLLRGALGAKARKVPRFSFGAAVSNPRRFAATALELEDLGVAAYNGQAANLTRGALIAAARIVSVDARHAAWIRAIENRPPSPQATDPAKTRRKVLAEVDRTGFVR